MVLITTSYEKRFFDIIFNTIICIDAVLKIID
jgi:hypothetical protein